MKISLVADVVATQVALFAEVGMLERRPELSRLCRRALSQPDNRLTEVLCQEALPGITAAGAKNLLRACVGLDLCDRDGVLRPAGEQAAREDLVAIPEQGVYRLWLAEHELLGQRVLHLERVAVEGQDRDFASLTKLDPLPLEQLFTSMVDGTRRFILRGDTQKEPPPGREEAVWPCELRWDIDFDTGSSHFTLRGTLQSGKDPLGLAAPPEDVKVDLNGLLRLFTKGAWDPDARRLRVLFAGLPEPARDTFVMDRPLGPMEVPGLGHYPDATLREVPLAPSDAAAAQEWAMWRFHRCSAAQRGYLSRPALSTLFAEATLGTPLTPHAPCLPPTDRLLAERQRARDRWGYWQIAAAEDLCP